MLAGIIIGILVLILVLWVWLIAPGRGADFGELEKFDYAHRGLHDLSIGVPENSAKAFARAVEKGYGIELDLQLTKDDKVVVHHDNSLKRSCGEEKLISDLTFEELQEYRIFGTEERIPTFAEVLKIMGGKTPMIVELKGYNDTARLCTLAMRELDAYKGLYCVESFDPRIVRWFKKNRPEIIRGQLMYWLKPGERITPKPLSRFEAFAARNLLTNFYTRPHFEAYDIDAHARHSMLSLKLAKSICGMKEVSWTLRSDADLDFAKRLNALRIFEKVEPKN